MVRGEEVVIGVQRAWKKFTASRTLTLNTGRDANVWGTRSAAESRARSGGGSFVLGCPATVFGLTKFRGTRQTKTKQTPEIPIFIFARAVTYSTLFIGLLLVFVPGRILERSGMARLAQLGAVEYGGIVVAVTGGAIALWCILTFVLIGRGTPAPFDPPRKLVVKGPYRYVRNPMYIGAALALGGAALFYHSAPLFGYAVVFLLVAHVFVVSYEEPTLVRLFGAEYGAYRARVGRWLARRPADARNVPPN
jgi:protein-S-isoprenylcysteine O-methyltransferase Ste14